MKYPRESSLELLHPAARKRFVNLRDSLERAYVTGESPVLFAVFETYRSPARQQFLKETTTSTKAGPWESTHQLGLAVDFVPYVDNSWSWDGSHPWDLLDRLAGESGLVRPIRWDRPHIEHPKADFLLREMKLLAEAPTITALGEVVSGWAEGRVL